MRLNCASERQIRGVLKKEGVRDERCENMRECLHINMTNKYIRQRHAVIRQDIHGLVSHTHNRNN